MLKKRRYMIGFLIFVLVCGIVFLSQSNGTENQQREATLEQTKASEVPVVQTSNTPIVAETIAPVETEKAGLGNEESEIVAAVTPEVTATAVPTTEPTVAPTETPEPTKEAKETEKKADAEKSKTIIVIDAGHQAKADSSKEPVGPGAKETKKKVSSGTQGRFTNVPEYEVNLQVAKKLEKALGKLGYSVIMVRDTNDVNISNSERAELANDNDADMLVRIHCNGSEDASVNGILTICPTKNNPYCSFIYEQSRALSDCILEAMVKETGAKNKGVTETDSMSGINWSEVPVTIVEMGYMTNKKEDNLLVTDAYQEKLVTGLVNGIQAYLATNQ